MLGVVLEEFGGRDDAAGISVRESGVANRSVLKPGVIQEDSGVRENGSGESGVEVQ